MSNRISSTTAADANIDLEVLTNSDTARTIGYRLGARISGPNLVVAGHNPTADLVYDRLLRLQPLCRLRGTLTLIYMKEMESEVLTFQVAEHLMPLPDEVVFLPIAADSSQIANAAHKGYWSVLRMCTRLGMISGRGVQFPAAQPG